MLLRYGVVCLLMMVKCIVTEVSGNSIEQVKIVANTTDHRFSCGLNNQDTVTWYYYEHEDGPHTMIEQGDHYKLDSDSLTICDIGPAEEGYYYCKIGDTKENASRLTVLGVPDIIPIGPELLFNRGNNITFTIDIKFINGGAANETVDVSSISLQQPGGQVFCYNNVGCFPNDAEVHIEAWPRLSVAITNASDEDVGQYTVEVSYGTDYFSDEKEIKFSVSVIDITTTSSIIMSTPTTFTATSSSIPANPPTTPPTASPTTPSTTTPITVVASASVNSTTSTITSPAGTTAPGIDNNYNVMWAIAAAVVMAIIIIISIIVTVLLVTYYRRRRRRLMMSKDKTPTTVSQLSQDDHELTTPTTDNKHVHKDQMMGSEVEPCYAHPLQYAINPSIYDLVTLRPQEGTQFVRV